LTSLPRRGADAVVARLRELRIVPVAAVSAERSAALGEILLRAGLPCLEETFRNANALDAIEEAAGVEGLLVGAGTILSASKSSRLWPRAADFAVAPCSNDAVIRRCQELGLPFFPGVATPTEIEHAREWVSHGEVLSRLSARRHRLPARGLGNVPRCWLHPDRRRLPRESSRVPRSSVRCRVRRQLDRGRRRRLEEQSPQLRAQAPEVALAGNPWASRTGHPTPAESQP
jgi:hypothetical protein